MKLHFPGVKLKPDSPGPDSLISEIKGINQVNLAVAEMEKVTQQNAVNAERSVSAS